VIDRVGGECARRGKAERDAGIVALAKIIAAATCAPGDFLISESRLDGQTGPTAKAAKATADAFWGEVRNAAGEHRTARLETANGYRLTADGTIMAVKFVLDHAPPGGYYSPSMLIGARCVEQLPGSTPIRVD
jgi:short subunit dehydrogenase-like uncharacterized protein